MATEDTVLKSNGSQVDATFEVDPAVAKYIPSGSNMLVAKYHGSPSWALTATFKVEAASGEHVEYFLKFDNSVKAPLMLAGEFASMKALLNVAPAIVPRPIAWGEFEKDVATKFLLMDFVDINKDITSIPRVSQVLAELHQKSLSPEGKFGFPMMTCHGPTEQLNEWDDNWARYFTKLLVHFWQRARSSNPPHPELDNAFEKVVRIVIPHLLDPLQTDGRVIKPCLVHGDLWNGNIGTNNDTGAPVIFDAASFFAHNEYELGTWHCHDFEPEYFETYKSHFPPSEPIEQWDDRLRLYSLKYEIAHTIGWTNLVKYRTRTLQNMLYLIERCENPGNDVPKPVSISKDDIRLEMNAVHPRYAKLAGHD